MMPQTQMVLTGGWRRSCTRIPPARRGRSAPLAPRGDAEVVAVRVGEPEVAQAPRAVGGLLGEHVAGGPDRGVGDVEVLDLEDDLDAGAARAGETLLREAGSGSGYRELGDRAEPEHDVAPSERRVVVLAALDGEADPRVEADRRVEILDEQLEPEPHAERLGGAS